ncbi:skin secretory protein xP2-like [Episyrphus balteatus]|uniref:skin secretory protein xP2-like n=1 Tax=Episyrphus balteatus TaxID=286459 RepID=UPI0024863204|nr:skin secretory protein xP2-like [Episyrphus balteatus]
MAKFIIVLCAFIATASAGPGLVAPLAGVPLAYASSLPYSSPLTYSPSLAYTSPVAYGLASGASSRIDIQNNYNVGPQFAVPFAARITAPYAAAPFVSAPLSYNFAQFAAPQIAPAPVALNAPLAPAPVAVAPAPAKIAAPVPVPFAGPQFIPAPLRYSAPLLSNYNAATPAFYGSPLPYAFPGQINAYPFAAPLAASPGVPIAGQFAAPPSVQLADPSTAATTRMTAVPSENSSEADSVEAPAKLVSEAPAAADDEQKFATPAPVDGPQTARDAASSAQSPVAPVRNNNNN